MIKPRSAGLSTGLDFVIRAKFTLWVSGLNSTDSEFGLRGHYIKLNPVVIAEANQLPALSRRALPTL